MVVYMVVWLHIAEQEQQLQNPEFYIEIPSDRTTSHKKSLTWS